MKVRPFGEVEFLENRKTRAAIASLQKITGKFYHPKMLYSALGDTQAATKGFRYCEGLDVAGNVVRGHEDAQGNVTDFRNRRIDKARHKICFFDDNPTLKVEALTSAVHKTAIELAKQDAALRDVDPTTGKPRFGDTPSHTAIVDPKTRVLRVATLDELARHILDEEDDLRRIEKSPRSEELREPCQYDDRFYALKRARNDYDQTLGRLIGRDISSLGDRIRNVMDLRYDLIGVTGPPGYTMTNYPITPFVRGRGVCARLFPWRCFGELDALASHVGQTMGKEQFLEPGPQFRSDSEYREYRRHIKSLPFSFPYSCEQCLEGFLNLNEFGHHILHDHY